jgi:hypothetical protein
MWDADHTTNYLCKQAFGIGQMRKLISLTRLLYELQTHPDRIHDAVHSSRDEMDEDWHQACIYFANDVLEGRVHLALQLDVTTFPILQSIWFDDVKQTRAYLEWEKNGGCWEPQMAPEHYWGALADLKQHLLDPGLKSGAETFRPIGEWLAEQYLTAGDFDVNKPRAHTLVSTKAERIWRRTGSSDAFEDWQLAERYAQDFYENLIPAVVGESSARSEAVLRAFTIPIGCPRGCEIIDAFEAALVGYFVDREVLHDLLSHECSLL